MPQRPRQSKSAAKSTVSGPRKGPRTAADAAARKQRDTNDLAAAFPFNRDKPAEFGAGARKAKPGSAAKPADPAVTGEHADGDDHRLVQGGRPRLDRPESRQRAAREGPRRFGRTGAHDELRPARRRQPELAEGGSARAGAPRGLHPPREAHALRPRAHPRADRPRARLGRARLLRVLPGDGEVHAGLVPGREGQAHAGVRALLDGAGERGSIDTPRDVRGFATKFYTDQGNFDIVGNNIPVFFIQDAMKFPDLVHALKPEPHHAMPQAASAHDTFWDFVSLMPESTHMLMWAMSDRDAAAQLPHDAGLRRPHLPPRERPRRVALRQVPLESGGGHALPRLGREREDRRRRPGLHAPRPVGVDRGGGLPGVRAGLPDLHRGAGRASSASTCWTRPRSCRKSWCR